MASVSFDQGESDDGEHHGCDNAECNAGEREAEAMRRADR